MSKRWSRLAGALLVILFLGASPASAERDSHWATRTEWRIGVGLHHDRYHSHYGGWHDGWYARHYGFRAHRAPWHYDPWYWRDPFYGSRGLSVGWTVPLVRHSDPWAQRAVPRQSPPIAPTPADRALAALAEHRTPEAPPGGDSNSDEQNQLRDGAVLAGQGLAALQRHQTAEAVTLLRRAFEQDPHNAQLAAQDPEVRSRCAGLRETLLHRFPYELKGPDRQFLHAVLHFYAGDLPSASYAAQMMRDDLPGTAQLRRALGPI